MEKRYTIFPLKNEDTYEFYKKAREVYWNPEEIDLSKDLDDFKKLDQQEQEFILKILAFFAPSDGLINENLSTRFKKDIEALSREAVVFYNFQEMIEDIHNETYSLMIEAYVENIEEREKLFNSLEFFPLIAKKAKWIQKWIASQDIFEKRLLAMALVEGVFFSGSFCAIYWFKERGILPGLTQSNELISKDETLHWEFAAHLFNKYQMKLKISEEEVIEIVKEAVAIEAEFVKDILPVEMIGMNSDKMIQYIEHVADMVIGAMGYKPVFDSSCPFMFMENMGLSKKVNFFERQGSEYSKMNNVKFNGDIDLDDDF
jgi:ribonucleoside-diphosphate reductase beta chain